MSQNPFQVYYNRYQLLKKDLIHVLEEKSTPDKKYSFEDDMSFIIEYEPILLNNLLMAGLGMGTLFLRMGAIIQMCEKKNKFNTDDSSADYPSFFKILADNLFNQLPSDGNWMNIWEASMVKGSSWDKKTFVKEDKSKPIYKQFVTFRNNIVHNEIELKLEHSKKLSNGFNIIDSMSSLIEIFDTCEIKELKGKLYFNKEIDLHPYVQLNKNNLISEIGVLPYLFQGAKSNNSKFIGTVEGDEIEYSNDTEIKKEFFEINSYISSFGSDKVFDHTQKIYTYADFFVGRDEELKEVLTWITTDSKENLLEVYSVAGMGKGALLAGVIEVCKKEGINHLHHFCCSGLANNLQAVLVHFMNQASQKGYLSSLFSAKPNLKEKVNRFQTKYTDAIRLFQDCFKPVITESDINNSFEIKDINGRFNALIHIALLHSKPDNIIIENLKKLVLELHKKNKMNDDYYSYLFDLDAKLVSLNQPSDLLTLIPEEKRKPSGDYNRPLVIILDGLDEAAVANAQMRFTDWFYSYNEQNEKEEKWQAPRNIKWIVSYRHDEKNPQAGYQFERSQFDITKIKSVQPLKGLNSAAVKKALTFNDYQPSESYLNAVILKGQNNE